MVDDAVFNTVRKSDYKTIKEIKTFLCSNGLNIDPSVEVFITVNRQSRIIACGGLAGNIIKCVAISPAMRGQGLTLTLATELVNLAYEHHHTELFIYTKTENEALFHACGFYTIVTVPGLMVLMENSPSRLQRYAEELAGLRRPGKTLGCIVLNANPFTYGHQYLVDQAARRCDWLHVFLVREDTSRFSYADRRRLVLAGTAGIPNLTVHEGSQYVISRATFPCYFIKDQGVIAHCHAEIDLKIFRQYLAPALGITHRFVGSEPFCQVTAQYNREMRYWLETPALTSPVIRLIELERLQFRGEAISASRVRRLLATWNFEAIEPLVPPATLHFLKGLKHPAGSGGNPTLFESDQSGER